ncbi:uncharacterized protein K02A2.6-like [Toxorhynchites rutilus septentrionalis]|uniref:uncharacterized protein K02A2.6-like n=1 Tax=Toxorhynchites rutilus septentrionalis TaxID=329112 RepID=UPI0024799EB0|nr:uncharacterized protein K02A2.6-like [Toxorhynchites rutilus septentrionalis]
MFKSDRILIPRSLRQQFIEKLYTAHLGVDYTIRAARESMYWPGMAEQITNFVRNCEVCMTFSASQARAPMSTHQIPDFPFQRVNIDLGEVKKDGKKFHMMVMADSFSDFIEVDFLKDTKTPTIIQICKRHFARHGVPEIIVTDNGPQFNNEEWCDFGKVWGFEHVTSAPYHAQGNGKSESAIKSMKQLYRKCSKSGTDFWKALSQHRNTPNAIGSSPNQRLFSRDTRNEIPRITNKLQPPKSAAVKQRITEKRQVTKASYDKRSKELPKLRVGDDVFVQRRPDIISDWEKATLVRQLPDRSCEVKTQDGGIFRRSATHVKPGQNVYVRGNGDRSDSDQNTHESSTNRVFDQYNRNERDNAEPSSTGNDKASTSSEEVDQQPMELTARGGRPKREIRIPTRFSDFVT